MRIGFYMDRNGLKVEYYIIGREEFRVTDMGEYIIIERKVGEWIRDFPPGPSEEFYDHICMIKKKDIPVLRKLLEKMERKVRA